MSDLFPGYLSIDADALGAGQPVPLHIVSDPAELARIMARDIRDLIREVHGSGRGPTFIIPVGPVDQFPILADLINQERLSLRDVVFINMDEYLTDDEAWLPVDHPLSFRGFMNRKFFELLDPQLAPPRAQRVFPDPRDPTAIGRLIDERGGVDACFGGIGINGHIAFNEPPEPGAELTNGEFAALPTRVLPLSRETRTINAHTVGGSLDVIPHQCITVGMREILASRRLRFYCNRPWQSGVVRRVLHGPISADCPASLLRTHADACLTITSQVAGRPEIRLR